MRRFFALALVAITTACSSADAAPDAVLAQATTTDPDLPTVLVYKSPTCGCCNGWVEHMEAAGFVVDARNTTDLMTVKRDGGVPPQMSSCHTAIIDGYVVEGHVPAEQVKQLLAKRPEVAGIAVPGMPIGSPGMEGANPQPYQVLSFTHAGEPAVFSNVDPR
ncbi:MAG: DUF411 domain-containing protein [Gemmatimonadota bacterium]|nr:DUF411 domain-containing protein [Gemmatimonadota bacterium]MDE3004600.1 DUF411 domain-containing protein [Gemmatimonadota bacterium]MDE3014879.1 DUF411 domain-containing protein [Gemmatimonadota bacterium]